MENLSDYAGCDGLPSINDFTNLTLEYTYRNLYGMYMALIYGII